MPLSTHVLDLAAGKPVAALAVTVTVRKGDTWVTVGRGVTDPNGRVTDLMGGEPLEAAVYRLTFATATHHGTSAFYPEVVVTFRVADPTESHHIPLLLGPFGYTTYRGS